MFHERTIERMVETVRPDASARQRWRARSTRSRSARRGSAGGETRGAPARGRVRGGGDVSSTGGAFDDVFGDSSETKFSGGDEARQSSAEDVLRRSRVHVASSTRER
jgi:hypothetical protein